MGPVIGDVVPFALGVAISPIPIIAAILMLLSPRARGTSVGFLLGWVLGIVATVVVFALLSAVLPQGDPSGPKPIRGIVEIALGLLLLGLAVQQWRRRPPARSEATLPKWMSAVDTMTDARALVLGFLLAALNPKNLLMGVAAGLAIGSDAQTPVETVVGVIVYTVIAASTVAIPVIAYLVASARMARPLRSLRAWLVHNNTTIMAVLLLVIGVVLIGKGIGRF
jgi:threonine/homoserine/homoserine lactone efflux protein